MKSARRIISTLILPAHHTITLNNVTIKGEPVNQGFNKQRCLICRQAPMLQLY